MIHSPEDVIAFDRFLSCAKRKLVRLLESRDRLGSKDIYVIIHIISYKLESKWKSESGSWNLFICPARFLIPDSR